MDQIKRRSLLKGGAGVIGTILFPLNLPVWAMAASTPSVTAPERFRQFSAAMVGVSADVIDSPLAQDDYPLADVYYDLLMKAGRYNTIDGVLDVYEAWVSQGQDPQQIADGFLGPVGFYGTQTEKAFARLTMMLWLFGVWFGGSELARNPAITSTSINSEFRTDFVVSSRAYVNGWIWRIAQAHAKGFSQFTFGSWAADPPSLADYGIDV